MILTDHDTIAALATPPGEGALAVIRVSGRDALAVADRCFRPAGARGLRPAAAASHTVHFGHLLRDGQVVDEVMLAVFRAPQSFTREDTVEITGHGG
ncbi:MAG TPA: tRNA uridine-5-carboxymethylaminomethyl(34) synthesis GTPase MnmE, partial [Verrucomicrobiota bacterium]|nr:tRNA uridine-5-carboxymethylaminomethyl(34) synthesis GTPase MnmE [Verrucomicrobiota bacterium]